MILQQKNTLFDSLIKNLENNKDLYVNKELFEYIEDIIIRGVEKSFNNYNPVIEIGTTYGYFKKSNEKVAMANKIFSELIYDYMVSKLENNYSKMENYNFRSQFIESDGALNIKKILTKFQQFMKEQYSIRKYA